jgi:hypothetical protein
MMQITLQDYIRRDSKAYCPTGRSLFGKRKRVDMIANPHRIIANGSGITDSFLIRPQTSQQVQARILSLPNIRKSRPTVRKASVSGAFPTPVTSNIGTEVV